MASASEAPASSTAEGTNQHTQNRVERPANTFGYSREDQVKALRKLREPFPPTEIRHLPRVWCGACKNSRGKGCQDHTVTRCAKCNQKMPAGGHIDLSYVGHAEATNRLLNVDPFWDWEPLTTDERGLPQVDGYKGLWIRLTVCGMTRLGYGHAGDKTGGDSVKEVIGDAIRNAGMRFGMALDLWTPSDLEIIESGESPEDPQKAPGGSPVARPNPVQPTAVSEESSPGAEQIDRLVNQYQAVWSNPLGLTQIRLEGKKLGLSERQVQGPPPESAWTTFDALLGARIAQLAELKKQAAQGGDMERGAA